MTIGSTIFKRRITKPLKNLVKRSISFATWDQWAKRSWSQEGEDLILRRVFEGHATGFYVDVGAHQPRRFSNTYSFYRLGWRGLNIDAMPGSMVAFDKDRPRDINLETGIGREEGFLEYYVFNEPALNGFSKELSLKRDKNLGARIEKVIPVRVRPLSDVLDDHLPKGQKIDFMSVDVEGLDLEVLVSNDWSKYRPKLVLVEILGSSLHEIEQDTIGKFMKESGYIPFAKSVMTVFFKDTL